MDNGAYHNQAIVDPFSTTNAYINYTVRGHSIFDQTKIRLISNNLLNQHNLQSVGLTAAPLTQLIPGTTYTDLFNTTGPTPLAGSDTPSFMAGRSFSISVTFGIAARERK
jgi:iron complex outermembrane receptor protein